MLGKNKDKEIIVKSPSAFAKRIKTKWLIWSSIFIAIIFYFSMSIAKDKSIKVDNEVLPKFSDSTPGVKTSEQLSLSRLQRELEKTQEVLAKKTRDDEEKISKLEKELDKEKKDRYEVLEKLKNKDRALEERIKKRPVSQKTTSNNRADVPEPNSYIRPPKVGSEGVIAPPTRRRLDEDEQRASLPSRNSQGGQSSSGPYVMRSTDSGAERGTANILKGPKPKKKDPNAIDQLGGMLPMGSFMEVAVLTGADFGASSKSQSNPQPTLLRIQDNSFLPNYARYNLQDCFAMGAGYGDLSSERAYITGTRISCVHPKSGQILEAEIQSYLVDSDGRLGMRGKVDRRSGAVMGKAMLAGFAEGAASILAVGATNQTSTITGSGVVSTVNTDDMAKAGGFAGADRAAEILAEQYLEEAESMFPVIAINAGRKAHLVVQVGQKLKWKPVNGEEEE